MTERVSSIYIQGVVAMTLLELIERIRKKDEVEFTGFDDKAVHIDKDLNLYTRDGQFYVLVAIPDMQERIEFERMVDQIGCFVTTVASGIECLDEVNRDKFDLIFIWCCYDSTR